MKSLILLIFIAGLTLGGCTLSFTNVMTSGEATDVVDSTPTTDATVSPNVSIPASVI